MTNIYTWPRSWGQFASGVFQLMSRNQASQSTWSGATGVLGPHAQFWVCQVQLAPQFDEVNFAISAFFSQVAGQKGLIRMYHSARRGPQYDREQDAVGEPFSDDTFFNDNSGFLNGYLPASIMVDERALLNETSVVVRGLPESTNRVIRRGDLIEFLRNGIATEIPSLHEVVRDAPTDALGRTRLEFKPGLRKGLAAGDRISLRYPSTVFRLIDDSQGQINYTPPIVGDIGFSLFEGIAV